MAGLLDTIAEAYMRNVGNPARQLVGGGVRGLLGFDPPEYADSLGMEAYRNAAALGNAPGINAPVGAFKAAAKVAPEAAMFIGALAKTWDKASNAKAVQMEKAGKDAREIWRETGNLKGPDGKWRQEISDADAVFTSQVKPLTQQNEQSYQQARDSLRAVEKQISDAMRTGKYSLSSLYQKRPELGQAEKQSRSVIDDYKARLEGRAESPLVNALRHPELMRAYPEKQSIRVVEDSTRPGGSWGSNIVEVGGDDKRSTVLHELQHAIQDREGFAKGGSGKEENYRRLAGEAEARATQARMNMTPAERRATFPYDSYDVPVDQLIVRGLLAP